MLRRATVSDLARLYELVFDVAAKSTFAARNINPSPNLVRSLLMDGVRKNGGEHAGSTLLNVIEFRGRIEAFMFGLLQPIYGIGIDLEAQDILLYATKDAPKLSTSLLIDAYVEWALAARRCRDINLSWTDVAGVDGTRLAKIYQRKGFQRCGEIWKRGA